MQVTKEIANRSYTGPDSLNPHVLQLEWSGDGEPQRLNERIYLKGSVDLKFLLLHQPTAQIGPSSGIHACRFLTSSIFVGLSWLKI